MKPLLHHITYRGFPSTGFAFGMTGAYDRAPYIWALRIPRNGGSIIFNAARWGSRMEFSLDI